MKLYHFAAEYFHYSNTPPQTYNSHSDGLQYSVGSMRVGLYTVQVCEWTCLHYPGGGVTYYCSIEFELQVDLGTWA